MRAVEAAILLGLACTSLGFRVTTGSDMAAARGPPKDCIKTRWFNQRLDHYHFEDERTWKQRYVICDKYWGSDYNAPIFLYAGNEGDVMMYVEHTGLMWENAAELGALVMFVEHRYYGQSQPLGPDSWRVDPSFLTFEQALSDYAHFIHNLTRTLNAEDSPVIVFGGSYGGMLAAWLRIKYPHLVAGAIAASAPIGSFHGDPAFQPWRFWEVVTKDARPEAGAAPQCEGNVREAFKALFAVGKDAIGRGQLQELMRTCDALNSPDDVTTLAYWAQGAFDSFAMGNYPYPSTYISDDPQHPLPAWPMRAACDIMAQVPGTPPLAPALLEALRDAAGLLYNASGTVACYSLETSGPAAGNSGPWDWQVCTELAGQEQPYYPCTGVTDMFWRQGRTNGTLDLAALDEHCELAWKVKPRRYHSVTELGGLEAAYHASNIVFSNGLLDPWSVFGLLEDASDTVVAVLIPNGAHHVDLMFSHPDDTPDIVAARDLEMMHVRAWVRKHHVLRQRIAAARGAHQRAARSSTHLGMTSWDAGASANAVRQRTAGGAPARRSHRMA